MNQWKAKLRDLCYPGGHVSGGTMVPVGTVTLNAWLQDAGAQSGRWVDVVFEPDELETVVALINSAIVSRDRAFEARNHGC